jgi:selenoprotein W-related protein
LPKATRAAAALKEELDLEPELKVGKGGIFEVAVNGRVVAKKTLLGFPSVDEIVEAVGKAL